jgi:CubicO group peptidase (beta-lactamase class C family)
MPLEHKPGEKSGYNGTEFLIVKMIVEKVSGMRLQDFLAKRIFEPLHMESPRYGDTLDIIPNRVSLYTTYSPSDVDPYQLTRCQRWTPPCCFSEATEGGYSFLLPLLE